MPIGLHSEIDVNVQSQTSPLFQYYLMRELKTDITLTANAAVGDSVVNVSAGHGFTVGSYIVLWENSRFMQCTVAAVSTNAITLCMPLYTNVTTGAKVVRGSINLAVDGTTPIEFIYNPYLSVVPIDIGTVVLSMSHLIEADDGKFGGIAALTNGVYFRRSNGIIQNLGNHTDNRSFREYGYMIEYPTRAPAGTYATSITKNIAGVHDQVIRVDPRHGDYIKGVVRDNLTGLSRFTISLLGSFTSGE